MTSIVGFQYFSNDPKTTIEQKIKTLLEDHIKKGRPVPIVIYVKDTMIKEEFLFNEIPVRQEKNLATGHFWFSYLTNTKDGGKIKINQSWKEIE